jgi:hypothetical protein
MGRASEYVESALSDSVECGVATGPEPRNGPARRAIQRTDQGLPSVEVATRPGHLEDRQGAQSAAGRRAGGERRRLDAESG